MQDLDRARDLDEVDRVDDPGAAPGRHAVDRLRVRQVRVHPRGRIDEPRAQMTPRVRRIARVAGQLPGGGQRRHLDAQAHQGAPVFDEVVGIGFAVAPDVRTARVLRVRPPVVAFGEEVVQAAGAARGARAGDGLRRALQVPVGGGENAAALGVR